MAKASRYKYFQPEQVSSLGKLGLVARMAVEGFITALAKRIETASSSSG